MLNAENLKKAIEGKALSASSIQSLAYELTSRNGSRSDRVATSYGRQLTAGIISTEDAEFLVGVEHIISVYDEVEEFTG